MVAVKRIDAGAEAYSAADIEVLTGLEPVRRRPGMYIGDTSDGSGLHHMVYEVVDNAIAEMLAGYASFICVTLNADGSVTVEDNGRGIPVDIHPRGGISAAEVIMTSLHCGGASCQTPYRLRGVGVCVVNALSAKLELTIWRGGKEHFMAFADGKPIVPFREAGSAQGRTGTRIAFTPSSAIFSSTVFCYGTLEQRLRELAFLIPGVNIALYDLRGARPAGNEFKFRGGLKDFVKYLDRTHAPLIAEPVFVSTEHDGLCVEAAFWWNGGHEERVLCYTNTVPQPNGGTHLTGFRTAFAHTVNAYATTTGIAQAGSRYNGDRVRQGLTGVVSVMLPDPRYAGATKDKLASPKARRAVYDAVKDALSIWFEEHPQEAKLILQKIEGAREHN